MKHLCLQGVYLATAQHQTNQNGVQSPLNDVNENQKPQIGHRVVRVEVGIPKMSTPTPRSRSMSSDFGIDWGHETDSGQELDDDGKEQTVEEKLAKLQIRE